ncbi:hypothetical protein CC1G_01134 [Coprinopsis cinerea okayama7|uniref:Uncharacterized protein n=1 Tax=Coprinopsis cinerea (strain Okayama-7 / 130 / ATCC MYA-4618 / FGSC 9003) TaxID=240176 RepID=A8NEM3_COPC7|nr:hypothetical protein CC1G_01134 [Coprinopsis cinerea okayama7\|eukprot:XP_001833072.2 hypothetical protein CC1G_01134 [Coprinopsis cinerea okayama7\
MLTHRGFSAWITVDDEPLPEYLVAVDESSHRVSCWIPGEEGQSFTVWWQDHGGKVDTCSFILLDGLAVPGRFLFGEGVSSRSGLRSSHMTEKPFVFTKVPQEEDSAESNKDAGTIVVKIKRVKRVAARPSNPVRPVGDVAASGKKKVGDLCVGFGQERSTTLQYHSTWSVVPYDDPESEKPSTYVSFVFRYRSAEFLESQGIAPDVKQRMAPKLGEKRRVSSLPPATLAAVLATPSPSPPKKPRLEYNRPRLTEPISIHDQGAFATRRTSGDIKRVASWKDAPSLPSQGVVIFPRSQRAISTTNHNSFLPSSNSSETSTLSDDDDDRYERSFS